MISAQTEYAQTRAALMAELAPEGILEQTFADEISPENKQPSIDRTRAQAHRILRQSMAQLRALQTERCIRRDLNITENIGLADSAKVLRVCNEAPAIAEESAPEPRRPLTMLMTLADKKLCADVRDGFRAATAKERSPSSATISS
jgi:hypothetical protein